MKEPKPSISIKDAAWMQKYYDGDIDSSRIIYEIIELIKDDELYTKENIGEKPEDEDRIWTSLWNDLEALIFEGKYDVPEEEYQAFRKRKSAFLRNKELGVI